MRHPTTGLSEDDLSRLTGSSSSSSSASCGIVSSSSSSSSSSSASSASNTPDRKETFIDQNIQVHPLHVQSPDKGILSTQDTAPIATTTTTTTTTTTSTTFQHKNNVKNSTNAPPRFNSTYLPEIINPLEWQKSRKRKERLDSTSTLIQDRKLQRSNSEELLSELANANAACEAALKIGSVDKADKGSAKRALSINNTNANVNTNGHGHGNVNGNGANAAVEVIRRVASEDFKRSSYKLELENEVGTYNTDDVHPIDYGNSNMKSALIIGGDENNASLANLRSSEALSFSIPGEGIKDITNRSRYETSPARSQSHSPVRGNNGNIINSGNNGRHRDSDDSECEHERRRSSERFCKTRLPPGRKAAGIIKKSSSSTTKYLPSKRSDESAYKYDLSALKYERRGFISTKKANTNINSTTIDHNDNNIKDYHRQPKHSPSISPTPTTSSTCSDSQTSAVMTNANSSVINVQPKSNAPSFTLAQESLPWDRASTEEPAPVLSRRYAHSRHHAGESIDTAAKLSKVMPYPQPVHKQSASVQLLASDMDSFEPLNAARAFSSLESIHTRDVIQQVLPAMMAYQTSEERLKLVNRRMTALKKRLVQLEEALEARLGYRPSQAERLNDKYMKNVMAELSKLRKERHELKVDPISALGLKVSGGMDAIKKLEKMKATLLEIEQNLTDKREDGNRSEALEELSSDQLVQEKTAVQHGLLYFESLYGRPTTKDERDAARPLYERYRQLKRMVSRTVIFSAAAGAPELPTILEHEAMVFESAPPQYSSNNSTETTNSPSESVPLAGAMSTQSSSSSSTTVAAAGNASSDESSATTTTTTATATATAATGDSEAVESGGGQLQPVNENISALNLEQLWEQLDRVRDEKKLLKQTIREYESIFEEQNGRKMLKVDRKSIETYALYKEKKAKTRLLQALIKKHISAR